MASPSSEGKRRRPWGDDKETPNNLTFSSSSHPSSRQKLKIGIFSVNGSDEEPNNQLPPIKQEPKSAGFSLKDHAKNAGGNLFYVFTNMIILNTVNYLCVYVFCSFSEGIHRK